MQRHFLNLRWDMDTEYNIETIDGGQLLIEIREEDERYETRKKQTARCVAFVYLLWGRTSEEIGGG